MSSMDMVKVSVPGSVNNGTASGIIQIRVLCSN